MKRLRISRFQVAILRVIRAGQQDWGFCVPTSKGAKTMLFGRSHCASTAERVTLHRSVRRLVANGMIADQGGFGCYRLTEKGAAWLQVADQVARERQLPPDPVTARLLAERKKQPAVKEMVRRMLTGDRESVPKPTQTSAAT